MKHYAAVIFIFFILVSLAEAKVDYYHFDIKTAERLLFSAVNRVRLNHRLPILKHNVGLEKAARIHAVDMVTRNFFDHNNPDGDGPRERALSLGIPYPVSENLGVLSSYGLTIDEVVDELLNSLMESPIHRANILNPDITEIGISFAQDKDGKTDFIKLEKIGSSHLGFGTVVVCQEFMKRGLANYQPEPFPDEIKKGESISLNGETYKDFDTLLIEVYEKDNGKLVKTKEVVLFERAFEEKFQFNRDGTYDLKISGNIYIDNNQINSEELVIFQIRVE